MILTLKKACLASVFYSGGSGDPEINVWHRLPKPARGVRLPSHSCGWKPCLQYFKLTGVTAVSHVKQELLSLNWIAYKIHFGWTWIILLQTALWPLKTQKCMHLWNTCNCLVCMRLQGAWLCTCAYFVCEVRHLAQWFPTRKYFCCCQGIHNKIV